MRIDNDVSYVFLYFIYKNNNGLEDNIYIQPCTSSTLEHKSFLLYYFKHNFRSINEINVLKVL